MVRAQPYHFTQSLLSVPTDGPGRCRDNTYKYTEQEERLAKSCGKSVVRRHPIATERNTNLALILQFLCAVDGADWWSSSQCCMCCSGDRWIASPGRPHRTVAGRQLIRRGRLSDGWWSTGHCVSYNTDNEVQIAQVRVFALNGCLSSVHLLPRALLNIPDSELSRQARCVCIFLTLSQQLTSLDAARCLVKANSHITYHCVKGIRFS